MAVRTEIFRSNDVHKIESEDVEQFTFVIPTVNEDEDIVYVRATLDALPSTQVEIVKAIHKAAQRYLKLSVVKQKGSGSTSDENKLIREWAAKQFEENGDEKFKLAERGRIPADVEAAYRVANPNTPDPDDDDDVDSDESANESNE